MQGEESQSLQSNPPDSSPPRFTPSSDVKQDLCTEALMAAAGHLVAAFPPLAGRCGRALVEVWKGCRQPGHRVPTAGWQVRAGSG